MDTATDGRKTPPTGLRTPLSEKELWDLEDLGEAKVGSRSTVWRLEREDPSFPRPVLIRGMKRWIPEEVRRWIHSLPRAGKAA